MKSVNFHLRPFGLALLIRTAGAICGMIETERELTSFSETAREKDLIALKEFKF